MFRQHNTLSACLAKGLGLAALTLFGMAVLAQTPASPEQPLGDLRTVGGYPERRIGHTVTDLGQGRYFLHGDYWLAAPDAGHPKYNAALVERVHSGDFLPSMRREPWIWLPERQGWKMLTSLSECEGHPYLQVVTPMQDGGVLITGGLCDANKLADDPIGFPEYRRVARLNGTSLVWETAPDLREGRIYHTASRLSDDSVLLVGGQRDPSLGSGDFPVLASVEWLRGDRVEAAPLMEQARASHATVVLDDDGVLVSGGFGQDGKALASVERWDRQAGSWQPVAPMGEARFGHRALRLKDGSVLVTGGFGRDGKRLASAEIWSPATGHWRRLAPLPRPVGFHDAALLANGDVLVSPLLDRHASLGDESSYLAFAYRWLASEDRWEVASTLLYEEGVYDFRPTISPRPDGSARIFGRARVWHWKPGGLMEKDRPWQWYEKPTVAAYDRQSVILAGQMKVGERTKQLAYRWSVESDEWQAAGELTELRANVSRLLRLPSGAVIGLGAGGERQNGLKCAMSAPDLANQAWTPCGTVLGTKGIDWEIELGLLPGGRAVAIVNSEEAFVFDEANRRWDAARVEWQTKGVNYGTPVRTTKPLAELVMTTPAGSEERLDISALAARYWERMAPIVDHTLSIGDQQRAVAGRGAAPRLLWNPTKTYWDYIYPPGHPTMGRSAVYLPDGCALSISPPSLFDPRTGKSRKLDTLPAEVEPFSELLALENGMIVIAGRQIGGQGGGLFAGKAGCAGFVPRADSDVEIRPVFAKDPVAEWQPKAVIANPETGEEKTDLRSRLAAIPTFTWQAFALAALIGALHWARRRRQRAAVPAPAPAPAPDAVVAKRPRPSSLRIAFWAILLGILAISLINRYRYQSSLPAQACFENADACLDRSSGLLKAVPSLGQGRTGTKEGPHIPCRFVGHWSSIQGPKLHRVTLSEDGSYRVAPLVQGARTQDYIGYWMVQSGHFVWRDRYSVSELDINRIESESDGVFVLIEGNGSRTRFERIESEPTSRCLNE